MENAMPIPSTPLNPRIGSQVHLDAAALLSGQHGQEIRALLEERAVLVFRDVHFDDAEMKAFAATVGTVNPEGEDGIFTVTRDTEVNEMAEYLYSTVAWHMDRMDTDLPPLGSMLSPRVIAREGGETEFCNTTAAYMDLPEEDKRRYEQIRLIHTPRAQFRAVDYVPSQDLGERLMQHEEKAHPLVWHHRSGRRSLVLGWTAFKVEGSEDEGDALVRNLIAWAEQDQYVYTHQWREGDLVLWDNTGAMHRVRPFDPKCGRRLHRVTLVGEEPITAV
jgi:alpha-ketoglutarate-dependent taurine dioxygenase